MLGRYLIFSFFQKRMIIRNYNVLSIVDVIENNRNIGDKVKIKGWIKSVRKHKDHVFLDVNDGSTEKKLQILSPRNRIPKDISTGASVAVSGMLNFTTKGQIELVAEDIHLYGGCVVSQGYPFAPRKQYAPEYIRQYLHLRPRTIRFSALLRVRSKVALVIHNLFNSEGYFNIHTPILTSNDCEGAGEVFKVIPDNLELLKSMMHSKAGTLEQAFFDSKIFLSVSGQLHLEAAVHGLSKVYTLGPTFRAENSKSRLHLSEFYMLEAEIAFLEELEQLIVVIEKLVKQMVKSILDKAEDDIRICQGENKPDLSWINKKFPVLTYDEAVELVKKNCNSFQNVFEKGGFSKEEEIFIVDHCGNIPTFIINWPKNIKPFYMKECKTDNSKVAALDLLVPEIGEILGGSLRENDYDKLLNNLPNETAQLDWYLELRKYGSVPTGGYGLGFERFLGLILGVDNIKDVIPFPRWPHNCNL